MPKKIRLVIIESPLRGLVRVPAWMRRIPMLEIVLERIGRWRNQRYARACMRDSLLRGEAPFASHLLYAQSGVLDDVVPKERDLGMNAGFAWIHVAHVTVVYTDRGISDGMRRGIENAREWGRSVEYRGLGRT